MTDSFASPPPAARIRRLDVSIGRIAGREPAYAAGAILFAALMAPTLFAYGLDERIIDGVSVWSKPLKFELSLALYFATLAPFAAMLTPSRRAARLLGATAIVAVFCALFEIVYIIVQASRGMRSHFNVGTPVEAAMFPLMGVGAILLTLAAPILGVAILRQPTIGLHPIMKRSIGFGLILTFALGAVCGMIMAAHGSHWVGGDHSDAGGLPLFGWSRTGGDLRVPHFLGIHAMQILPLAAGASILAGAKSVWWAYMLTGAYVLVTVLALAEALLGIPLVPLFG